MKKYIAMLALFALTANTPVAINPLLMKTYLRWIANLVENPLMSKLSALGDGQQKKPKGGNK